MTQHEPQRDSGGTEEYVTLIAPTLQAVMGQFRARGLGAQGYAITGPVARHSFAFCEEHAPADRSPEAGATELFQGRAMVAATFRRSTGLPA